MFEIEYKGANSLIINTKKAKIVVDPKMSVVGLKDLSVKDAIELPTEDRFAVYDAEARLLIDGPGEYGIADCDILGIPAQRHIDGPTEPKRATMYRIESGDLRLGVIGNIYEKVTDDQLESLGVIDILIIPVGGGGYTLDATGAASLVRAISPKVVIPVHYADDAIKYEVPQMTLKAFVDEMGLPVETVTKYKAKQLSALPTVLSLVELKRS